MIHNLRKTPGIFVADDGRIYYADYIVDRLKPVETRSKNMLSAVVGLRVAIIRTGRGRKPMIIGYADVVSSAHKSGAWMEENRDKTMIPKGSKYDVSGSAKWCYFLENAERCEPFPLPENAIRHGRSWCEF